MTAPATRQPIGEQDEAVHKEGKTPKIENLFKGMGKANASDLHLKADKPPFVRIDSTLRATKADPLTSNQILEMVEEVMTAEQREYFHEHGSIDLAYELPGSDRFRINVFRQRGRVSVAARRVTRDIPDFESLNLPPVMAKIAEEHQGLVLLAGPTGSGKSTTIASMMEYINQRRPCHIVTVEDPIEYLYTDKKALVNQREIGIDVEDFDAALKYLMREDPDVVLVGEMRDHETFQAALQASETGHLVFGTIHASSAHQTIGRILDLFPPDARGRVRQSLAFNLKAVICQRLLPSIKEGVGRVPAVEIMVSNPTMRQLITDERDAELADLIAASENAGMQNFTTSLLKLIDAELIEPKVAYEVAPNVDELKMRMKGISSGRSGLIGGR